jgi:hypothetical protein
MIEGPRNGFALVIDTDQYAGNFGRNMTAFLVGKIGECRVGEELVEKLSVNFDNVIGVVSESNGCRRPTVICIEPKSNKYNSVAIFFKDKPSEEQIFFIKERLKLFKVKITRRGENFSHINILGIRMFKFESLQSEILF